MLWRDGLRRQIGTLAGLRRARRQRMAQRLTGLAMLAMLAVVGSAIRQNADGPTTPIEKGALQFRSLFYARIRRRVGAFGLWKRSRLLTQAARTPGWVIE